MEKMTEIEVIPLKASDKNKYKYVREGDANGVLIRSDAITELWPVKTVSVRECDARGVWHDVTMNVARLHTAGRGGQPLFITPESYEKLAAGFRDRLP